MPQISAFYGSSSVSVSDIIPKVMLPRYPSLLDIITAAILWLVTILALLVVAYGSWLAVRAFFAGEHKEAGKIYAKTIACLGALAGVAAIAFFGIPFVASFSREQVLISLVLLFVAIIVVIIVYDYFSVLKSIALLVALAFAAFALLGTIVASFLRGAVFLPLILIIAVILIILIILTSTKKERAKALKKEVNASAVGGRRRRLSPRPTGPPEGARPEKV
jgi:hypothetical protein